MSHASILRRFSATLAANAVNGACTFLTTTLLARGLGASLYGDLSFLIASFTAIGMVLDLGAQQAYYTFLSQGERSRDHLRFFGSWLAVRVLMVVLVVGVFFPQTWLDQIWMGQTRGLIILAFLAFFASVPLRVFFIFTAESARQTVFVQSALAVLSISHLAMVFSLSKTGHLSVRNVYVLIVLEYLVFASYFLMRFDWSHLGKDETRTPWRKLIGQYATYCSPLMVYCGIAFLGEFADRWLLQYFGGSTQQGFFSLSNQFATITLLGTTALLNIFWKEIAEAQKQGAVDRVRELYKKSSRTLFFFAAAGGSFLIPHSRAILLRLAGTTYEHASLPLALMLLYPAYQTLGQLNGAYFYATEDTKTHVWLSTISIAAGLPLTYLFLAPASAAVPGLALGATGLAARWSFHQMFFVSWGCWMVARRQKAKSDILHHLVVLLALLSLSFACKAVADVPASSLPPRAVDFGALGFSAALYGAFLAALAWRFPGSIGIDKSHIVRVLRWRPGQA